MRHLFGASWLTRSLVHVAGLVRLLASCILTFLLPAERSVLQPHSVFQSAETVDRVAVQPAAAYCSCACGYLDSPADYAHWRACKAASLLGF